MDRYSEFRIISASVFGRKKNPDLFRFHSGVLQCGHMYPTLLTLFDTNLKIKMEEYKYKLKKPEN